MDALHGGRWAAKFKKAVDGGGPRIEEFVGFVLASCATEDSTDETDGDVGVILVDAAARTGVASVSGTGFAVVAATGFAVAAAAGTGFAAGA